MNERAASSVKRIAVIGAGITGLSAAHRLRELLPEANITVFEATSRAGGIIRTETENGYLLEQSADSFVTNVPDAVNLCRRLGLEGELIPTNAAFRRAFIARGDDLYPVPHGFSLMTPGSARSILQTPLMSFAGKVRLLAERFVPSRNSDEDESVASFARRRLGQEALDRIVQPLVGGIYTADTEKLSLAATFPQYQKMEREFGSIARGSRRLKSEQSNVNLDASGARYGLFTTFRAGLQSLIDALTNAIGSENIQLSTPIQAIAKHDAGWSVKTVRQETFDGIVVAMNATSTGRMLQPIDAKLSAELAAIPYASSIVALLGYDRAAISHPLDGFGFVVPPVEHRHVLACSFNSVKFPRRAPDGKVLLRVFLGGAGRPEVIDWDDEKILNAATADLSRWLGVRGEPELVRICRWKHAMPQYHVGHLDRVARIRGLVQSQPRLELAGAGLEGVGIPHCVRSGEKAAERLVAAL